MKKILFFIFIIFANSAQASCKEVSNGIPNIINNKIYSADSSYFSIDVEQQEQSKKDFRPFNDFLKNVSKNSDLYLANGDKAAAQCGLKWLKQWAKDSSMLGRISSNQGEYERKWILTGIALSYIKLKPEANLEERKNIESWLSQLADAVLNFTENSRDPHDSNYYWVGLASMATGVATANNLYIDEARKIYEEALNDISDDGSLPLELNRAARALHYHNFALAPLVLMAELAKVKNEDWYASQNNRLDSLAKITLEGIADNSWFEKQTESKQTIPQDGILGWAVFYLNYKPEFSDLIKPILYQEPFINPRLGGNISLLAEKDFFGKLEKF